MTTIVFKAGRIERLETHGKSSEIEIDMDHDQMFELLAAIQNRVGYGAWDLWVARLDPDAAPLTEAFSSDGNAFA